MSDVKFCFICFEKDDEGRVTGARTGQSIEEAEKVKNDDNPEGQFVKDTGQPDSEILDQLALDNAIGGKTISKICYSTLRAIDQRISPYHPLIELTTMFRFGMQKAGLEGDLYKFVKDNCALENRDDKSETYKIEIEQIGFNCHSNESHARN